MREPSDMQGTERALYAQGPPYLKLTPLLVLSYSQ